MHHSSRARAMACIVTCLLLAVCNRGSAPPEERPAATGSASPTSAGESGHPRIVVLGDSLSAGYGLLEMQSFPALLQAKLNEEGYKWEVVNASISGDTSASGLQRVDWALGQGDVRILILELGANDGLRGLAVSEMKKNLAGIIEAAQSKGASVMLTGMEAPPNFGPEYTVSFRQVYRDLAKEYKVTFLPFLLDKVAGNPSLNQSDGIHPNIEGTVIVADTVWNALRPMVDAASSSSSSGGLRPPEPPLVVARGDPVPRSRLRQGFGEARRSASGAKAAAPPARSLRSFAAAS